MKPIKAARDIHICNHNTGRVVGKRPRCITRRALLFTSALIAPAGLALILSFCQPQPSFRHSIVAGGDCLLARSDRPARSTGTNSLPPTEDARWETLKAACRDSDAFIFNLETTVGQGGSPKDKRFVFRAPLSALQPIKCFPHPVAALANNHSMDYGPAGLIGTIEALDTWGISRAGGGKTEAEASAETRVEPGSVSILSFGFDNDSSSYCDLNGSCIAPLNIVLMKQKIAGCEATSAATVVMLHWGVEYDTRFNGCQQTLAHSLVRAGADLVIGTGPHVLQGIEVYQGSLICYSLGNLVFDDLGNDESSASIIVRLTLAGSGDRLAEAFEIAPLRTADILAGPERPSPDDARGIVQNIAKRSPDTGILTLRPTGDDHGLLWFRINR